MAVKKILKKSDANEASIVHEVKHFLIPKHELLTNSEKVELLKKYEITVDDLPKILITDPAIRTLGAKASDVIRVVRNSPTSGTSYYYRGVVSE